MPASFFLASNQGSFTQTYNRVIPSTLDQQLDKPSTNMIQKISLLVALLFVHTQGQNSLPQGPRRVGPGRCDKDYIFLKGDKEVNQQCLRQCYYTKYKCGDMTTSVWLGKAPLASRTTACHNKCIEECDRCQPDGFDQRADQPSCPKPQCLIETENYRTCRATCGGLSKRAQKALTKRYKREKLYTGVVGSTICSIFCNCKFSGPRSFPWNGESLCANLTPLPQRRLRAALYDFDSENVW